MTISAQMRLTKNLEMPLWTPGSDTNAFTLRVEMPTMYASTTTHKGLDPRDGVVRGSREGSYPPAATPAAKD
jgi:hypothetical protein